MGLADWDWSGGFFLLHCPGLPEGGGSWLGWNRLHNVHGRPLRAVLWALFPAQQPAPGGGSGPGIRPPADHMCLECTDVSLGAPVATPPILPSIWIVEQRTRPLPILAEKETEAT
jgi:hypothetical protein